MQLVEKLSYLGVVLPNFSSLTHAFKGDSRPRRFVAAQGLVAHWHETWPEDSQVLQSWDDLNRSSPSGTAFHTPAWQHALGRAFIRAGRFRLLTILDQDRVLGVLPLQFNRHGVLEAPGSMISDYIEPLIHAPRARGVWSSILMALKRIPGIETSQVVLDNCRLDRIDSTALYDAAAEQGFALTIEQTADAARIPLPGTFDEYLAALKGHDRKEIRRKLRNAETRAAAELVIARTSPDVAAAIDQTFAFMRASGGAKALKARWTYRPMFDRSIDELVSANRLKVFTLKLEGQTAAGLICFDSKDGPMLWAAGFNPEQRQWSPGIVLMAMAIRQSIADKAPCFDLLRGMSRYKDELGSVNAPVHRITLTRREA